jgi:tetratricopeptide (TPR) repeat protein
LELAPNESTSHAFLAATLVVADAPSDAIKHIETAIRLNPNYPAWFGAARVQAYRMTGRRDQALKAAIELAQRHPEFIRGRVLQAAAYVDCCMPEEARQAIQVVLELDPNYTISDYVEQYKLKNASLREEIATALRQAGLPD